jgi:hypothetical protein
MGLKISCRMVTDRMATLGVTEEQVATASDLHIEDFERELGPECPITIGQISQLADLLHTLPLNLLVQDCGSADEDLPGDVLLVEFALAAQPRRPPELAAFLGWSAARLANLMSTCGLWGTGRTLAPAGTGSWLRLEIRAEQALRAAPDELDRWLPERTAPDPFDAIALLRIAHAEAHTAVTDAAELRRLTERRLAVPGTDTDPWKTSLPFATGLAAQLHPDLRFALDLDDAPAPREASSDATPETDRA